MAAREERDVFQVHDDVHADVRFFDSQPPSAIGRIEYGAVFREVIDHPVVQRLRHIRQLGMAELVYPGATHTRFSHSVGTAFLAQKMVDALARKRDVAPKDRLCIVLAALLHDVGHPCFSHQFESFMQKSLGAKWAHEDASVLLCDELFASPSVRERLEAAGLDAQDFLFIKELISPPKKALLAALEKGNLADEWAKHVKGRPVGDAWMYEIVSNWRCGLDVDRFDYILRDAHHCGLATGVAREVDRFFSNASVIVARSGLVSADGSPSEPTTIACEEKDMRGILRAFFEERMRMFHDVYCHRKVQIFARLFENVLHKLDESPNFRVRGKRLSEAASLAPFDAQTYLQLTDTAVLGWLQMASPDEPAAMLYNRLCVQRRALVVVGTSPRAFLPEHSQKWKSEEELREKWKSVVESELGSEAPPLHVVELNANAGSGDGNPLRHLLLRRKDGHAIFGSDDEYSRCFEWRSFCEKQRLFCYEPQTPRKRRCTDADEDRARLEKALRDALRHPFVEPEAAFSQPDPEA